MTQASDSHALADGGDNLTVAFNLTSISGEKKTMKNLIARFVREEEGQDIIEYSLLAAFISISGYLVLQNIGSNVNTIYSKVQTATNAGSSAAS
jgi:Flp pilus assembly pilin Flp